MRFIVTTLLLLLVATSTFAQGTNADLAGATARFMKAERDLRNMPRDEYRAARENLARQALAVAEKELSTKDAEELLHWILQSPENSSTAGKAVAYLVEHHSTSKQSVQKLLSYAKRPTAWSPALFSGFVKSDSPRELVWIVATCAALHEKAMLEIADEIRASNGDFTQYESHLGPQLSEKLAHGDISERESRVIAAFIEVASKHGKQEMGGISVRELAEGSIFSVQHLRLGKIATGLSGTSIDGEKLSLDNYRGRVMLIDFWATWCAPCITAMPDLKKLRQELDKSKFVIIGVSADTDKTQLRKVMKDREIDWPIIVDSDSVLQKRWQTMSLPAYYVLDEKCVVRYRGDNHHKAATVAKTILGGAPQTQIADVVKGLFALYDTNKDGRIEGAEILDEMKADVKAADQNKDNALSIEELTTFLKGAKVTTEAVSPPNPPSKSRERTK